MAGGRSPAIGSSGRPLGGSTWQDAVANTGSDATTRTVTVPSGEVRRFRVRAINSIGTGDPSNVAVSGNAPATGAPAISGSGRVGQMLTASTDGISDANGLTGASYGYRWFHLDGTTETAIAGATSAAYMPLPADLGTRIGVRADFTDDGGFDETLASAAVTIRAAMPPAACPAFERPRPGASRSGPGRSRWGTSALRERGPQRLRVHRRQLRADRSDGLRHRHADDQLHHRRGIGSRRVRAPQPGLCCSDLTRQSDRRGRSRTCGCMSAARPTPSADADIRPSGIHRLRPGPPPASTGRGWWA